MFARRAFNCAQRRLFTTANASRSVFSSRVKLGLAGAAVGAAALPFAFSSPAFAATVPHYGEPGTKYERTFIAIKPDGVQRALVGRIIQRFEDKGYKLVGLKMIYPSLQQAQEHYSDLSKKPFYPGLCKFFSSGPIVAMVWEGKAAIKTGRQLLGETDPLSSAPGSIRGDFSIDLGRNIIHGSDGPESAQHEISFWFTPAEVSEWTSAQQGWIYER